MDKFSDKELLEVAKIHRCELDGADFLSSCSTNFIKYFYSETTKSKFNHLFVAKESEEIVGFVYFTLKKNALFKEFVKVNLVRVLLSPPAFLSLIKTVILKTKNPPKHRYNEDLVYIAVSKDHRSKGYAKELLASVEKVCSVNSMDSYYLQVFKDNVTAVQFYQKCGFAIIEEYSARNKTKLLMRKTVSSSPES